MHLQSQALVSLPPGKTEVKIVVSERPDEQTQRDTL